MSYCRFGQGEVYLHYDGIDYVFSTKDQVYWGHRIKGNVEALEFLQRLGREGYTFPDDAIFRLKLEIALGKSIWRM